MPLVSRTFDQLISFTRTSAATYVNSAGNIVTTPASKNLLTFTEEFANAAWTKTNATVTANSVAAPDGLMTADTLVESAATANHVASAGVTLTAVAHVFSIHLKKGSGATAPDWVQLYTGGTSTQYANFNLSTGATGNVAAGSTASITPLGGGWYRCSLTFTPGSSGAASVVIAFTNNADTTTRGPSYAGAVTSDVFLWGAQLETGSTATSYVRNFGGLFPPRFDYDPVTLQPRGLLIEEQRTNLLLRSEEFDAASWSKTRSSVTANATTSPDGTVDADKLVEDTTASNTHQVGQTFSAVSGTSYSFSVYLKASERTWAFLQLSSLMFADAISRSAYINLSTGAIGTTAGSPAVTVSSAGNGWWRVAIVVSATATASAAALIYLATGNNGVSYTGDGTSGIFVWGAQLEAGAFATSYIPTVASQVTRTADQASIVAPNFAPWYNQSEGTFVVEASTIRPTSVSAANFAVAASDGTSNERNQIVFDTTQVTASTFDGGVSQALLAASYMANSVAKVAFAYAANNFAASFNGAAATTDTSGTLPIVDRLTLGSNWAASNFFLNGHIRRISYYPSRLSNAQLQALSA